MTFNMNSARDFIRPFIRKAKYIFATGIVLLLSSESWAQFSLNGQMLVRSEFRNGYGKLINENSDPAGFIAHRARLEASYKIDRLNFFMSIQDVRTWGSTPSANVSDDFLSVHEAWGEVSFGENWKLKLGRQELNYDNARFLGNLDWALQARSHDFILMKYEKGDSKLHFGAGFNQDGFKITGNTYTIPNNYKAAQMVSFQNKVGRLSYSFLFWNDGRQFIEKDDAGTILNEGIRYMSTLAIPTLRLPLNKTMLTGQFYYQFGNDVAGKSVSATNFSLLVTQEIAQNDERGSKYRITAGFESLSGTASNELEKNNSFSPLYGTNHAVNGLMDLFYVGNNHFNTVGLNDLFLRSRYDFNSTFWIQGDYHHFSSAAELLSEGTSGDELSKGFGSELDFTIAKVVSESVSIQVGYSQFFTSDTFAHFQNNDPLKEIQNWAYIMFVFRPNNKAKFIGVPL
ncbi:alginate export family protein [Algoriphagus namhaensis]|uniref:Alginate export family protein n=1 Tax=Algoriphagus namhaensis TaxID=915353 RepID=A0ABV8AM90_9BACT